MKHWIPLVAATAMVGLGSASLAKSKPHAAAHAAKAKAAAKGDPKAGEAAFTRNFPAKCQGCHEFNGKGGKVGPKLDDAGKGHTEAWLLEKLKNPKASNPKSMMPAVKDTEKNLRDMAAYLSTLK